MRKILILFFIALALCPQLWAQLVYVDVKEITRDYSVSLEDFVQAQKSQTVNMKINTNDGPYTTKQMTEYIMEDENDAANIQAEEKITSGYKTAIINIPSRYQLVDYVFCDNNGTLLFPYSKSVALNINGIDANFKLDYAIKFADERFLKYFENNFFNMDMSDVHQALTLTLKYSPKYFTLKKYEGNYDGKKTKTVHYKGQDITVEAVVFPVLKIEDKYGRTINIILEPDLQNIYTDFAFVRGGK